MVTKEYTWWQKIIAAMAKQSVEWRWATEVERCAMYFESLSVAEQAEFFTLINQKVCQCPPKL